MVHELLFTDIVEKDVNFEDGAFQEGVWAAGGHGEDAAPAPLPLLRVKSVQDTHSGAP
uniref:Uncharacterized protein n=1 Tax=Arundo donax TaxID=35708 RepID=A0A0A9FJ73_ARUDO